MKSKIGFRVYEDFKRPDRELIQKFEGIPSSNIGDLLNRLYCMRSELYPFNSHPLLGPAFTVKAPCGDNLILQKALDLSKPGDILVIDAEGCTQRSLFGEMMVNYAAMRGIAGFVIDGTVRDTDALKNSPIPVYAIGVTPQGPYKHGPGEINVPIACCGQVVCPGDILVGDDDGVVVIKPEYAEELAAEAAVKHRNEINELKKRSEASPDEIQTLIQKHIEKWDKQLAAYDIEYIPFRESEHE